MPFDVMERCLELLAEYEFTTIDITGGEPELHHHFEYLVMQARRMKKRVTVRHNLTVVVDGNPKTGERKQYLPEFFASNGVEVVASLPNYRPSEVDAVRGNGAFARSIVGLRRLNSVGYGRPGTGLTLKLVHNRDGPVSPTEKARLEAEYRDALRAGHGVEFNELIAITNVPLNRFRRQLEKRGDLDAYIVSLADAFTPSAVAGLVCRSTISVGYDGRLYDCDFNQALQMQVRDSRRRMTVFDFNREAILQRRIRFAEHCFACTAGGGAS
jgi:radical SAM/Cys-rich protein